MADTQGKGGNWQGIAEANGIENPRFPQPGQLINLNITTPQIGVTSGGISTPPFSEFAGLNVSTS